MDIKAKDRLDFLDICKGLGILLVILGHIYEPNSRVGIWIYSFHMPLFLIVSGILLNYKNTVGKNIKSVIISRIQGLLVPYLIFEFIAIVIYLLVKETLTLTTLRYTVIDSLIVYYCRAGATWFLPCLFIAELLFIIMKKVIKNDKLLICSSLIIYLIPFVFTTDNHYINLIYKSFDALGFIVFGYYGYERINSTDMKVKNMVFILFISIVLSQINGAVALNGMEFGNCLFYSIDAILGSMFIIFISKKIDNKYLKYIGKNTLIILCTHLIIQRYFIDVLTGKNRYFYLDGLAIFIVVCIIEIPIIEIINRYFPFMIGKFHEKSTKYYRLD